MSNKVDEAQKDALVVIVPATYSGRRLDWVSAQLFSQFSRGQLQKWIQEGHLMLNAAVAASAKVKVMVGDRLTLQPLLAIQSDAEPQSIPLDVVFEDDHILVLNKSNGLVVHPGAGVSAGTVMNGLLHHHPSLINVPRAGIVHRLDKDTTGLMVVAKNLESHHHLVGQLQARTVSRRYTALVVGALISGGVVNQPLGRHPVHRTKMAVIASGKPAVTHYRVDRRLGGFTLLDVSLETGRTHQIRVHLSHLGYPLVGDATYLGRLRIPKGLNDDVREMVTHFPRQALHARELSFIHPASGEQKCFEAPLPNDMKQLIAVIANAQQDINSSKGVS